jgi:hypothetical protein
MVRCTATSRSARGESNVDTQQQAATHVESQRLVNPIVDSCVGLSRSSSVVADLADPYETEKEFRLACNAKFGITKCKHQCIELAVRIGGDT